jgi:hypothetical protein
MSLDAELQPAFRASGVFERLTNRTFGFLVGLSVAPQYIYLLQVRGRKTSRLYCSPVNLLEFEGRPYPVVPPRTDAVGSQCGGDRVDYAEEREVEPELRGSPNSQ